MQPFCLKADGDKQSLIFIALLHGTGALKRLEPSPTRQAMIVAALPSPLGPALAFCRRALSGLLAQIRPITILAGLIVTAGNAAAQKNDHVQNCIWTLGDSLTFFYERELVKVLPQATIIRGGQGGQSSTQIAARAGARPTLISLADGAIPAKGRASISEISPRLLSSSAKSGEIEGTLAGVPGQVSRDADDKYFFVASRGENAAKIAPKSLFVPNTQAERACTLVLWAGHINVSAPSTVLADIDSIVAAHDKAGGRFLVLSLLLSANYGPGGSFEKSTLRINDLLARKYKDHFIDIRRALIEQAAQDESVAIDDSDRKAFARGIVPAALRQDHIHLNSAGSRLVADQIAAAIRDRGW